MVAIVAGVLALSAAIIAIVVPSPPSRWGGASFALLSGAVAALAFGLP